MTDTEKIKDIKKITKKKIIDTERVSTERELQNKHSHTKRLEPVTISDLTNLLSPKARKQLSETTGSLSQTAGKQIIKTLINGISVYRFSDETQRNEALNSAIALLHELDPQDAAEGMICANMVMTFILNGLYTGKLHIDCSYKLILAFNRLTETLAKYRNKGRQRITVQHVNINEGANAVIGDVNSSKGAV